MTVTRTGAPPRPPQRPAPSWLVRTAAVARKIGGTLAASSDLRVLRIWAGVAILGVMAGGALGAAIGTAVRAFMWTSGLGGP